MKLTGENDILEKDNKRLQRDLNENQAILEVSERQRSDYMQKLKDIEKRTYEIHREKQDSEIKNKGLT